MKTLFAFLGGAVAGAAVALLMAPEKGEVVRGRIRHMVDEGVDEIRDKAQKMRRHTNNSTRDAIDEVAETVKKA